MSREPFSARVCEWAGEDVVGGGGPCPHLLFRGGVGLCPGAGDQGGHSLGTRLMARSGRSTRTVLTADKLTFCRSSEYSSILQGGAQGKTCESEATAG